MYEDILESEFKLRFRIAGYVAKSALMSHDNVDYDKASGVARVMYSDMIAALDYIGQGRSSTDIMADDRKQFVKKYLDARRRTVKTESEQHPDTGDQLDIKAVGK